MEPTYPHTALLFFSRSAAAEQGIKRLLQGKNGTMLYQDLIDYSLDICRKSNLPVHWISEQEQRGATFGEKITHAFSQLFAQGYERVIAIGNDCLSLESRDLTVAAHSLETNDWVLGPTRDGGAYLIGLNEKQFDAERFRSLSWEEASLSQELQDWAEESPAGLALLASKTDVDHLSTLQANLQRLALSHPLRQWLSRAFSSVLPVPREPLPIVLSYRFSHRPLRAPPLR